MDKRVLRNPPSVVAKTGEAFTDSFLFIKKMPSLCGPQTVVAVATKDICDICIWDGWRKPAEHLVAAGNKGEFKERAIVRNCKVCNNLKAIVWNFLPPTILATDGLLGLHSTHSECLQLDIADQTI